MFKVPDKVTALEWPFAKPQALIDAIGSEREAREAIARQWISEGVPYAFKECPAVYEYIRHWIGNELHVHAKSIAMTGSGSLGFSMAPKKKVKNFDSKSDLDFFIVSDNLFGKIVKDFYEWSKDYRNGTIKPKNEKVEYYWDDNQKRVPQNIHNGFINTDRVPNLFDDHNPSRPRYPAAQKVNDVMSILTIRCEEDDRVPTFKSASIRCYENWGKAIDQLSLNLESCAREL